jgi:hypothetical protein
LTCSKKIEFILTLTIFQQRDLAEKKNDKHKYMNEQLRKRKNGGDSAHTATITNRHKNHTRTRTKKHTDTHIPHTCTHAHTHTHTHVHTVKLEWTTPASILCVADKIMREKQINRAYFTARKFGF